MNGNLFFKKSADKLKTIANLFLLLPVYFIGVGLSKCIKRFLERNKKHMANRKSFWISNNKIYRNIKKYEEML